MKHFRLIFILLLFSVIVMSGLSAWLFASDMVAPALLCLLGMIALCLMLWGRLNKLTLLMWNFAKSLEVGDTSTVFDTRTDNAMLRETLETFNSCILNFHRTTMELETRKLYYDRILKVMSHEMGNGITPVIALCADIRKHPERYSGERLTEAIELIDNRSRSINRFLKAYYALTHIPEPQKENIDSHDFMTRVKRLIDLELEQRGLPGDVCRYISSEVTTMSIDVSMMEQVMVNIIRNALDAVAETSEPQVTVAVSVSEGKPYIMVEDNGCGLDAEVRDELFQPFVTTKPEGTGVGLYLSRQIVRRHGGDLRLIGTTGHGATAIIDFR